MKAKRILALLCAAVLLLSACTKKPAEGTNGTEDNKAEAKKDVTITLPATFLEGAKDSMSEELTEEDKANGILSKKINDDGSFTFVMTAEGQDKILTEARKSIEASMSEITSSGDYASIKNIEYNDDFNEIKVTVDKEKFESGFESFMLLAVYISCGMYQIFDGIPADEMSIKIDLIDSVTNEVYETMNYPQDVA